MDNLRHPSKLKLKIAFWYTTHKILLKRASLFFISLALILVIAYSAYGLNNYFSTISEFDDIIAGITENQISFETYQIRMKPISLSVKSVNFIKTEPGKFDFIAKIENLNKKWFIKKITYQFVSNNFSSSVYEDFILPSQSKFLFALNQSLSASPSNLNLKIVNLEYERVRSAIDVSHEDFFIEDVKFIPATGLPLSLARVKFQVTNNSLYNFWDVPFKIIIYSRSNLIGFNIASITQLKSEETRPMEIVWFDEIKNNITEVIIVPDINLFDQENYMPRDKEVGELK